MGPWKIVFLYQAVVFRVGIVDTRVSTASDPAEPNPRRVDA